jgi:hypothetical protein
LDETKRKIERTVNAIPLVDDPTPLVNTLNGLQRRAEKLKSEWSRLHSEVSGVAAIDAGFDWQLYEHIEAIDTMPYETRRAVLRDFDVKVMVQPKDHPDDFTINWAFELPLDYLAGYPDELIDTVNYTRPDGAFVAPSIP